MAVLKSVCLERFAFSKGLGLSPGRIIFNMRYLYTLILFFAKHVYY